MSAVPGVELFGFCLEHVDLFGAAEQVVRLARSGTGGLVVTMNVDHVVKLEVSSGLRAAYQAATLRFADGMPLVWLSRLLGHALPGRVAGADLVPLVLELAQDEGLRVHLVGGRAEVARLAEHRAREAYPLLDWSGHVSPPRGFELDADLDRAVALEVAAHDPHIVLVCLGAPKQEEWALRHRALLPGSVLLCVGGAVDFLAGTTKRAPQWVSRLGLEWVFRLVQEPRRLWRRYLVEDLRFALLAGKALSQRYDDPVRAEL